MAYSNIRQVNYYDIGFVAKNFIRKKSRFIKKSRFVKKVDLCVRSHFYDFSSFCRKFISFPAQ